MQAQTETDLSANLHQGQNSTPSPKLDGIAELVENYARNRGKVGVGVANNTNKKPGQPYWVPVRGIIRWEQRQHYYDQEGRRRTRVLKTQKRKPKQG